VAMKLHTRITADVRIIDCSGDIDLYSSGDLREALLAEMRSGTMCVLVNMTDVTYIDSSGVATLVEGLQLSRQTQTKFGLFGLRPNARSVLQLARLDKVFVMFEDEAQALLGIPSVQPFGGI
jgi:anti-sigma B factor antagonist